MVKALSNMHIAADLRWEQSVYMLPGLGLCILDTLEDIIAYEEFGIRRILIEADPGAAAFEVCRQSDRNVNGEKKDIYHGKSDRFTISSQEIPGGYRVTLTTGGGLYV